MTFGLGSNQDQLFGIPFTKTIIKAIVIMSVMIAIIDMIAMDIIHVMLIMTVIPNMNDNDCIDCNNVAKKRDGWLNREVGG